MNTDPAKTNDDAPPMAPAAQDDPHEPAAPSKAGHPSALPGEYQRQHHGREAMDRWMLHKTLMEDLADELTADGAPSGPPPAPTAGPSSEPPAASQE